MVWHRDTRETTQSRNKVAFQKAQKPQSIWNTWLLGEMADGASCRMIHTQGTTYKNIVFPSKGYFVVLLALIPTIHRFRCVILVRNND